MVYSLFRTHLRMKILPGLISNGFGCIIATQTKLTHYGKQNQEERSLQRGHEVCQQPTQEAHQTHSRLSSEVSLLGLQTARLIDAPTNGRGNYSKDLHSSEKLEIIAKSSKAEAHSQSRT